MLLNEVQRRYIGRGIRYKNTISPSTGSIAINEGFERINQSIFVILSTPKGSIPGNRRFGSLMHRLVFEQNDLIFADMVELYIKEALDENEPRITVMGVTVISFGTTLESVTDDSYVDGGNISPIRIDYVLRNTFLSSNYVYPFNREELE